MSGRAFETRPPDISLIFKQMTKLDKMLKKESQAGTKAEQRKNDEVLTSSPACTKPNVVCSQSYSDLLSQEAKFKAIDLLNTIGDGLVKYKINKKLYESRVILEFPEESYNRFIKEMKVTCPNTNVFDIYYGGLRFSLSKADTL